MFPKDKVKELKRIREDISTCQKCSLRSHYDKPVPCIGSPVADIMFIGEAPGAEEVDQAKPFVGKSGKMLRSAILDAGIDLKNIFVTNVLCCRPLNNVFPKDIKYIHSCNDWLYKEIKVIQPKIIVSIGGKAHKYIRQSDIGITQAAGIWEKHVFSFYNNEEKYEAYYMATLHPSFCMRGPDNRFDNPVMNLDRKGKENLFREHIASIINKQKEI